MSSNLRDPQREDRRQLLAGGNVVCKRPKFVFVQHMPAGPSRKGGVVSKVLLPGASAMKKAKMATHKGTVKEAIHSVHLDVSVEDINVELEESALVKKLQVINTLLSRVSIDYRAGCHRSTQT